MRVGSAALLCSALLCGELKAQGVWVAEFDHEPNGAKVHPSSDSIANPGRWITVNGIPPLQIPGQRFGVVHACLIPSGPHRGEVLVWDGNHTLIGTRAYQPWSIVNPYFPGPNPFVAGGGSAYRFHNATLQMPAGEGELFCNGQRWMADGRLFAAGGTRVYPFAATINGVDYPPVNTGMPEMWEGAKLVYQWDATPTASDPFGKWYRMADLEVERWYPTVATEGTSADRALIVGGTDFDGVSMPVVNNYESYRVAYNAQPTPSVLIVELKPGATPPPPSARRYLGPSLAGGARFTDYPRLHALGQLDPISTGSAPRWFLSGMWGQGIRWAHDPDTNPSYAFDLGQEIVPSFLAYGTSLLYPAGIGAAPSLVVRIGGGRVVSGPGAPTNRVESATIGVPPSTWSSGTPNDIQDMIHARYLGNVVILPTGDMFAVGGTDGANSVLVPEILRANGQWEAMAAHNSPRNYHSCAVLLPDARVLVCGGEGRYSDYEIYEPDYLQFAADHRPANVAVFDAGTLVPISQTQLQGATYDAVLHASWADGLAKNVVVNQAVLVAPAALTHHDDGGQRHVRLLAWAKEEGLRFKMPASEQVAPPGWYMLFLVTNEGVPSNAFWINLR
jgi:hypothetical protein